MLAASTRGHMTVRFALSVLTCMLLVGLRSAAADGVPPKPPAPALTKVQDVEAGPLFNQAEADQKCPTVCKAPATWNRTWRTTKPGAMSVCGCAEPAPALVPAAAKGKVRDVEAGPLFDQKEAAEKCPQLCAAPAKWTGGWRTIRPAVMSVCACEDPPVPVSAVQSIATGPIRSAAEAKKKCTRACKAPLQWNGDWRAKGRKAATCDCIQPSAPAAPPSPPPAPRSPGR